MKSALKRKLRNWLLITLAITVVTVVIQLLNRLVGMQINSSGFAIVVGLSVWFALEGEQKFAEMKRKAEMKQKRSKKGSVDEWDE